MKLRECLNVVKTQNYEIWIDHRVIGIITRELLGEDEIPSYIFSNMEKSCDLIDYLDKYVEEIIPVSTEVGKSRCKVILEGVDLPFY